MSLLSTGVSGLRANQAAIDVIGNNIANINTPGFKSARATFSDLMSQTIRGETVPTANAAGSNPAQIGLGVQLSAIQVDFDQGAVLTTNNSTDVAIQGSGLFILEDGNGTDHYTRAGAFTLDANGTLVDSVSGYKVQGVNGDILIPPGRTIVGTATSQALFTGNLDASVADGGTHVATFSVNDSLGTPHTLTITFTKNFAAAAGRWDWAVTESDANITGLAGATGSVVFNASGAISSGATGALSITYAAAAGVTSPQAVTLDFGSAGNAQPVTGYSGTSTLVLGSQDGNQSGRLQSFSIGTNGVITGFYDNGVNETIDTLQLALFPNPSGLIREGSNLFRESGNSGLPSIGAAGAGGRGTLIPGGLEQSNVDLSEEFTSLITAQRGFEASARLIRVGDELLQTTVNIKQ
jgi:flagellar hook protein FlgE